MKTLSEQRKIASDKSLGSSSVQIYSCAQKILSPYFQNSKSHLDFGSGKGLFLESIHKSYPQEKLFAADLMLKPKEIKVDIQWNASDLNGALEFENETFDSISALEIIEHLENPRHMMRELYRMLKREGVLLISTPNNESWRSILSYVYRGHFVAFTDSSYPAHINPLNRKDLARAAQEAGFKILSWSYTNQGCIPGATFLTWQQLSFNILKGLRFSDNLFLLLQK